MYVFTVLSLEQSGTRPGVTCERFPRDAESVQPESFWVLYGAKSGTKTVTQDRRDNVHNPTRK